jgi:hypothetical protein
LLFRSKGADAAWSKFERDIVWLEGTLAEVS